MLESFFLAVWHKGLSASYLILAVILARFLLKKAPKGMICILWTVVGLRLLCPVPIETAFSLVPARTDLMAPHGTDSFDQENTLLEDEGWEHTGQTGTMTEISAVPKTNIRPSGGKDDARPEASAIGAGIWLAGAVLLVAYLALSWHRVRRNISEAVPAEADGIRFYQCSVQAPFLFGLAVPKIYVPYSVSEQELFYILKHEQAHKRRYDYLTKPIGYLLLAVYWFQPLVWGAYLLFCRDIELACDESVVRQIGDERKKAYSQALLSCALNHRAAAVCPASFGGIEMKKRIKNILNYKKPGRIAVLAAAAVCAAVTICFATEAKSSSIPQTAGSNVSRTSQEDLPARTACVKQWAEAFCSRDAGTVFRMLDDKGRKQFGDAGLLEGEHSFGWSSPWPWETDTINDRKNYKVLSVGKDSAKILYYAWTSDPHVTVWAQVLMYQYSKDTGNIRIQNASLEVLDNIHNAKQFYTAYPDGQIDGTQMDYYKGNGVGEALDRNIRQSDDAAILRQPQTAAMYLLNIQNNPSVVRAETDTAGSSTIVTFTFLEDGSTASVKMIRPFGEQGIWVPQTDTAAAYGTLMAKSQTVSKKDFWLYGVSTMAGGKMRLIYKNGKTLLIKGRYKKASTMEGLSDEADKQYSYSLKAAKNCIVEMVEADNVQTMDYADWAAGQSLKKGDRISFISAAFWIKNKKIIKISFSA